jgi:hypothetical protein
MRAKLAVPTLQMTFAMVGRQKRSLKGGDFECKSENVSRTYPKKLPRLNAFSGTTVRRN